MKCIILVFLLVLPGVAAVSRTCTRVLDPPRIDQTTRLCADNYYPKGISITADNIVLDCGTGVLQGAFKETGITIQNRKNITLKNCQIAQYHVGILIKNSQGVTILHSNLIRNMIGIKIIDSSAIVVEESTDISISKPVQLINSKGNTFHYVNKNLQGDQCRLNQCNKPSGVGAREESFAKAEEPKKALRRLLNNNIRAWLGFSRA